MATIYDVARRAGVSIATVSAVINRSAYVSPELTVRVNQAIEALDYTVNQLAHSLQTRSTRTIGMLIPDVANPDPFFGQVVRGAEDVFREHGYLLTLGHTYNSVEVQSRYLAAFRSRMVEGVLLFQNEGEDRELERLLTGKKPVVFVGRVPAREGVDVVATDIRKGTSMAMDHLLGKGHTRVGLVTVGASMSVSRFRIAAWRAALRKRKLAIDDRWVARCELRSESGREAVARLLDLAEPPTAIFADNLVLATGALRELHERGLRSPEDVEVTSSDDAEWLDVFRPALTTVVQPSYELGARSAEVLLDRIRHPRRAARRILLPPELKVRT
jgi:LacI family transcriptional regulator